MIRKAEFLAVDVACKERAFDSSGFSADGTFIFASAVPQQGMVVITHAKREPFDSSWVSACGTFIFTSAVDDGMMMMKHAREYL